MPGFLGTTVRMIGAGGFKRAGGLSGLAVLAAVAFAWCSPAMGQGASLLVTPPRPPAPIPGPPMQTGPNAPAGAPGASLVAPGGGPPTAPQTILPMPPVPSPTPPPPAPAQAPIVPAGQVALAVSARFGHDAPAVTGGLHWRVYHDKPDANGAFRPLKEDRSPSPIFILPPGGYVVHVAFGLASVARRVQLRSETVREVFEIPAGGVRFEGRVGDSRVPAGQISFDVFRGSQFEPGEKRPVAQDIGSGDVVLLPEGVYHVVSNYGDGNALVRSDIRVQAGKLTDVTINHRAAVITLKLVTERGGEALANTQWTVLTPGGDVIKESIGAFPKVILAEGDYLVIARNEGRAFNREFKVDPGFDREIEVVAR